MSKIDLVSSVSEFKQFRNIDRTRIMRVLEDVFRTILRKKFGTDEHCDVIVNVEKGDLEIWLKRTIVPDGEVKDPNSQIAYTDALKLQPDFDIGEEVYEEITIDTFGRRAILAARQTLIARLSEIEKDDLYQKYKDKVGDLLTGEVYQVFKKDLVVIDEEHNELLLPKNELINADFYKKGDTIKAIVKRVEDKGTSTRVLLSRTDDNFLKRQLETAIPEIIDGIIAVRSVAREPGERAKVAVETFDDRIDPVGACVGVKGSRIHGIVRELRNENIDVIAYTNNIAHYIRRALTPAVVSDVEIHPNGRRAAVYLAADQISLAIGKNGMNIKLAIKLTGMEIDVYRTVNEHEEDDIELDEFLDEIDPWIINALKSIGCDTARSVLELTPDELMRRADFEEETVKEIREILRNEFSADDYEN